MNSGEVAKICSLLRKGSVTNLHFSVMVRESCPVFMSQNFIVWSTLPVKRYR
jgi:hypothetical protein